MNCPTCGKPLPAGARTCPHCHAAVGGEAEEQSGTHMWCRNCGYLIPPGVTDECPHCHMPLSERPLTAAEIVDRRISKIEPLDDSMEDTHSMARIQSAIPPTPDDGYHDESTMERLPRWRVVVVAAVAAVLVVGGTVLAIFRPWDPNAYVTHATEDADTSMEGFPGVVPSLSGQDKKATQDGSPAETVSGADMVLEAYQRLGALSEQADENASLLGTYLGGDASVKDSGYDQAQNVSIEVSNIITQMGQLSGGSTDYADDATKVVTLGNYLRNRMDAMQAAWENDSQESAQEAESWKSQFESKYGERAPAQPASGD